jgi:hypothetical protein
MRTVILIFTACFDRLVRIERADRCDEIGRNNMTFHNQMMRNAVFAKRLMLLAALAYWMYPSAARAGTPYKTSADAKADIGAYQSRVSTAKQCVSSAHQRQVQLKIEYGRLDQEKARLVGERAQADSECRMAISDLEQGLYCSKCGTSKSEFERRGVNFYEHLQDVQGEPIPAPPEVVNAKRGECAQADQRFALQISSREDQQIKIIAENQRERMREFGCANDLRLAEEGFFRARRWAAELEKLEKAKKLAANALPKPLAADKFGLGKNMRSSEYFVQRAYLKNGDVITLGPGVTVKPEDIDHIATHRGVDFASRDYDDAKKAKPMSFKAGMTGDAWATPGSQYNTINVRDPQTGNIVQYLHSSEPSSQFKNCSAEKPCKVYPWTELGKTGQTGGSPAIHLHVQVKDRQGNYIDPDMAFLPKSSPFYGIEAGVQEDLRNAKAEEQKTE